MLFSKIPLITFSHADWFYMLGTKLPFLNLVSQGSSKTIRKWNLAKNFRPAMPSAIAISKDHVALRKESKQVPFVSWFRP